MDSPITLMAFPDIADPDIACTGPHGSHCLEIGADVRHYQRIFTRLRDMALPPGASLTFITHAAELAFKPRSFSVPSQNASRSND